MTSTPKTAPDWKASYLAQNTAQPEGAAGAINGGAAQTSDIDKFAAALREASCSLASLPPDVLAHIFVEDWKSAFIAWFEGRDRLADEDWLTLLNLLRELMPDLFSEGGAFSRPIPEGWSVKGQ